MELKTILKRIEGFGETIIANEHSGVFGNRIAHLDVTTNWFDSYKYFLIHAVMRGRRDEDSLKYYDHAILKINSLISKNVDFREIYDMMDFANKPSIKNRENLVVNELKDGLPSVDILMIMDSLRFVNTLNDKNIVNFCLQKIRMGEIYLAYLVLKDLYGVKQKIASFFLRNLVMKFNETINAEDLLYCLPFDTWIYKICQKLEILNLNADVNENNLNSELAMRYFRQKLIRFCIQNDLNPIYFNQGCWYVGFNSSGSSKARRRAAYGELNDVLQYFGW